MAWIRARDVIASSLAVALLVALPALSIAADKAPAAQLIIHIDAPVLHTGGTVLVVANPISKEAWARLPSQPPSKTAQTATKLAPGDKLFDAAISSKVSIIEFVYPEGGTFDFKLRATGDQAVAGALRTKRILVGSGYYTDKVTGQKIEWKDVSVIHIDGPEADERFSRLVRASSSEIMNTGPAKTQQAGVTVYAPSAAQLEKALIKEPQ